MNRREAKRQAYGIAAQALRQAMESDLVHNGDLSDEDQGRLYTACEDLKEQLARRYTNDFAERAAYR
jgi:hypothetical protein